MAEGTDKVTIVVVGRPGAGKTTLLNNVFGNAKKVPRVSLTRAEETFPRKQHNVSLDIVYIDDHKKVKKSTAADLVLFCIPVGPGSRFTEAIKNFMKSLNSTYDKNIWNHCLVVYTFSNQAWDACQSAINNSDMYQRYIQNFISEFQDHLQILKVTHKSDTTQSGLTQHDQILLDNQTEGWIEVLFQKMLMSTREESVNALMQFKYGKEDHIIQGIEAALEKNEEISRKLAHGMFVGPTGSGKTSLMDRLLGRPKKEFSPSTGVAEQIAVVDIDIDNPSTFAFCHAATGSNDWKEVQYSEFLVRQMGQKNITRRSRTSGESLTAPESDSMSSLQTNLSAPQNDDNISATIFKCKHYIKIKNMIRRTISKCGWTKELKNGFFLNLRDIGCPIEFQEMLPLLTFGPSIFFFVFRLDRDFKSKFTVEYRKNSGNCYTSSITTEEAFLQFLASVYAIDTLGEVSVKTHKPFIFIVGTHRDMLRSSTDSTIKALNKHLHSLIKESGCDHFVQYREHGEDCVMFTVDNTSDNEDYDFMALKTQVSKLIHGRSEFIIEYPISYLLFSLELQNVKCSVLTLEECKVIAAKNGIKENKLVDLLQFLHLRIGVIQYFNNDTISGFIVNEPPVLFNKATDLILKTYSCDAVTTTEAENFKKKGILTEPITAAVLGNDEISPSAFLEILAHLRITASFPLGHDREKKFFFPAILRLVPESSREFPESALLPLSIKFKCNHVPKGLFGALVTCLEKPEEGATTTFTLMQDKIFRDQVSFVVRSPGVHEMALKLHYSYLEIKICSEDRDTSIPEVCNNVRQIMKTSIQQSLKDLHYNVDRTAPEMCLRCDNCSELHVVERGTMSFVMHCTKNFSTKKIPPQGECWYGEESPVQPPSIVSLHDSDLTWLLDKLGLYAFKWKDIALGLGFTSAELSNIEAAPLLLTGAPLSYLRAVLSSWLQWAPGDVRGSTDYATLQALKRAVDKAGLGRTAREL